MAELFNRVVAVEPDSRLADDGNFSSNVTIDIKTSEEACFQPGSVDAIISATAFHWMDQQMVCRNVSRWLRPGGVFFPFAYHEFSVEGTAKVIFDQEFDKWRPFRDRRLVDNYDYEDALKTSRAFGAVIPFVSSVQYDLSAEFAFGLISTFSYARAYAGAQGDADAYFRSLKKAFTECGKRHTLIVPIVGALGVKN